MIRMPRAIACVLAGLLAVSLAGCGGFDGVELNGKIFDAMGVNNTSAPREPKMAQRSGLVVPPSTEALPAPGSGQSTAAADVAALQDPDKVANVSQAEKERQQAEYCKVHYEQAMARGDQNADMAQGPLGPCKGSVLTALQKWQSGGSEEDEEQQ